MNNSIKFLVLAALSLSLGSCKKEENTSTGKAGKMVLEFNNKVGSADLKMDGTNYTNAAGETFTVSKFNYYISNIKLNNDKGGQFAENESYHLVQHNDAGSKSVQLNEVPAGNYQSITFTIGVDSLRNVSGAQTGALDPINGMFWSWSTGYIMLKLEGTSPQSTASGNNYQLHPGGFKGAYNTIRTVTISLPAQLKIDGNEQKIHLNADVLKILSGNTTISFANTPVVMAAGANAFAIANNYQNMFTIESH